MDTLITYAIGGLITVFFVVIYLRSQKKKEARAQAAVEKGKLYSEGPKAQHPHIDNNYCIGCGTCTSVCPEGDVLAMIAGKAVIVNGHKCIGHGLCADACPVGAITMVMASPSMAADMPHLTSELETTLPNLFIVGELGGLALIKNAVNQGRDCVDTIAARLKAKPAPRTAGAYDVLVIGAGPAGISASLRAIEHKLSYLTLERDEVGGTVAKYPRQKLVMTSPVEFPMYGKFKKLQLSKENLLAFWDMILNRADFNVSTGEKVEDIKKDDRGIFTVHTVNNQYRARAVVLALGRAGEPRKLGVKGEDLPKVMYRLIEADHYINKKILVVGGHGLGQPDRQPGHSLLPQRAFQPHQRAQRQAHRRFREVRKTQSPIQLESSGVQAAVGHHRRQRQQARDSQRLRLDLRRRLSAHRLPQEDRDRFRLPRPHARSQQSSQASRRRAQTAGPGGRRSVPLIAF